MEEVYQLLIGLVVGGIILAITVSYLFSYQRSVAEGIAFLSISRLESVVEEVAMLQPGTQRSVRLSFPPGAELVVKGCSACEKEGVCRFAELVLGERKEPLEVFGKLEVCNGDERIRGGVVVVYRAGSCKQWEGKNWENLIIVAGCPQKPEEPRLPLPL